MTTEDTESPGAILCYQTCSSEVRVEEVMAVSQRNVPFNRRVPTHQMAPKLIKSNVSPLKSDLAPSEHRHFKANGW